MLPTEQPDLGAEPPREPSADLPPREPPADLPPREPSADLPPLDFPVDPPPSTECDCDAPFICESNTKRCLCPPQTFGAECLPCNRNVGEVEWPQGSGECIPDPCLDVACGPDGTCTINEDGAAVCDCGAGWTGKECDRFWKKFRLPPFAQGMAFDSFGDAWFATNHGLLHQRLQGTPLDTSDDDFRLLLHKPSDAQIAVDSIDRVWLGTGEWLHHVDGGDMLADLSLGEGLRVPLSSYDRIRHMTIDQEDRLWLSGQSTLGVLVLPDLSPNDADATPWLKLFEDRRVTAFALEGEAIWLATGDTLAHVSLGSSLADAGDDEWTELGQVPALDGKTITGIFVDDSGRKWLNTERGVVRLDDAGLPSEPAAHTWSAWSPPSEAMALGNGPLLGFAPDGALWLKSPTGSALRIDGETILASESPFDAENQPTVTEYAPKACPLFRERQSLERQIRETQSQDRWSMVSLVSDHDKWVVANGNLYFWHDSHTPLETSDDVWLAMGRPDFRVRISTIHPRPLGGLWVGASSPIPQPNSCDSHLYHHEIGEPLDALDDRFTRVPVASPECYAVRGLDQDGHLWVGGNGPRGASATVVALDASMAPDSVTPQSWVTYPQSNSDRMGTSALVLGRDDLVWLEGTWLDYGDSIVDTSDDQWLAVDRPLPNTLVVDSSGLQWLGYKRTADPHQEVTSVLQAFDDGGTPLDPADDTWSALAPDDGLPFQDIRDIQIDGLNRKWVAAEGYASDAEQLCSLLDADTPLDPSDDQWTCYGKHDGLAGSDLGHFTIDSHSNLWIVTDHDLGFLQVRAE